MEQIISILTGLSIFTLLICIYISYLHMRVYFAEPINNITNYYWSIAFTNFFVSALAFTIMILIRPENPIMLMYIFLMYYNYSLVIIAIVALKLRFANERKNPRKLKLIRLIVRMSFVIFHLVFIYFVFNEVSCITTGNITLFMRFGVLEYDLFLEGYSFALALLIYIIFPKSHYITGKFFKGSFGLLAFSEGFRFIELFINNNAIKVISLALLTISVLTLQLSVLLEYKKNMAFIEYNRYNGRRKEDRINGI